MTTWSEASDGLRAVLAVVRRSPIIFRPILAAGARLQEWTAVRKSTHADAFVLAWIASHARAGRRARHVLH